MRGVRFTKDEVSLVLSTMAAVAATDETPKAQKWAKSVIKKLEDARSPQAPGVAAGPLEAALIAAAGGKVVSVGYGSYARLSRQATALNATPEQMRVVGTWMAAQRWLTGPLTIYTVLNKWGDWLARAKATAAPDGFDEGLGARTGTGDVGQGSAPKRPATTAGRRAPGLGGKST